MRRIRASRASSDVFAATQVALKAIQSSADAFPPLKSAVSAVLIVLELSENVKSNRKRCERIAQRAAKLVQDIWSQTRDLPGVLPAEVQESIVEIKRLVKEIKQFLEELKRESVWERLARQERNKNRLNEYARLLDEATLLFTMNLELSLHRLHAESIVVHQERHDAVLAVSRMSEDERLQLLTRIHGKR